MRLGIRGKLFAVSFGLIIVSLVAGELYLRPAIEANLLDRIRADLFVRLALVERAADARTDLDRAAWDALADDLAPRAHGRVTFIDAAGTVIGDSEVAAADLANGSRTTAIAPEVAAALAGGAQSSTRYSATIQKRLMYAADPDGRCPAAAAARPGWRFRSTRSTAAVGAVRHILWGALLVALVVALVASTTVAQVLSRALRRMTDAARRMAAGDLAVRLRPTGNDEVAELGRALDAMAASLAATLTTLRGERDLLGLILQSMREGVLVLDQEGRMLLVNPALRATLGIPADDRGARRAGADPQRGAAVDPRTRAGGGRARSRARSRPPDRGRGGCWSTPRRCRWSTASTRGCSPCSSTSPRRGGWRPCARTSSPTCRTSCARRSPPYARRSTPCA